MSKPTFEDAIAMVKDKAAKIRAANMTRRGRPTERAEETACFFDMLATDMEKVRAETSEGVAN